MDLHYFNQCLVVTKTCPMGGIEIDPKCARTALVGWRCHSKLKMYSTHLMVCLICSLDPAVWQGERPEPTAISRNSLNVRTPIGILRAVVEAAIIFYVGYFTTTSNWRTDHWICRLLLKTLIFAHFGLAIRSNSLIQTGLDATKKAAFSLYYKNVHKVIYLF